MLHLGRMEKRFGSLDVVSCTDLIALVDGEHWTYSINSAFSSLTVRVHSQSMFVKVLICQNRV